jgi:hypothetical protein
MTEVTMSLLMIAGLVLFDALAQPMRAERGFLRSLPGTAVLIAAGFVLLGGVLAIIGSWTASVILVVLLAGALALVSNIKRRVLGEPLVFTDLALVTAVFQHPQFYLSAIKPGQRVVLGGGVLLLFATLFVFSTTSIPIRLEGLGIAAGAGMALAILLRARLWSALAQAPDLERDTRRHGLVATLLVYWHHWRRQSALPPCTDLPLRSKARELVVIVQCESFADPAALFGDQAVPLPNLEKARHKAWAKGHLLVHGFGAYTMRTEFGVLFGIAPDALRLRQFDPFLTGIADASWALPNRLDPRDWRRIFVHPHDMRFYGRDVLMPAAGFDTLIGEETFPSPAPGEGRYVTDAAICERILALAADAEQAALIYAVTIENHGPWSAASGTDPDAARAAYQRLLGHSDAMLGRLLDGLATLGRPVTLCFFGDHRPSIPKVSVPGGERHTPYVIVRFDETGAAIAADDPARDRTPAELNAAVLQAIASGRG